MESPVKSISQPVLKGIKKTGAIPAPIIMGENTEAMATIALYTPKLEVRLFSFSLSNTKIAGGTKPIDMPNKTVPINIQVMPPLSITKIRQPAVNSMLPNIISVLAFKKFHIENTRVSRREPINVIIIIFISPVFFVDIKYY